MSEAMDAEREVEDLFNEEILGLSPPDQAGTLPPEAPPEPKPLDEVPLDDPEPPVEEPEEESTAVEEPVEEAPAEEEPEPEPVPEGEEEYVAWAKKQYGNEIDLESPSAKLLARAAFEKERLLGKKAEEARALQAEAAQREAQARIDALNTPGVLTPEEDGWVHEALTSDDPGEWAYNALQGERPDLYAAIMDRWSALGEQEARQARVLHSKVLQAISTPQPSEQETYAAALGQTFLSLGLDIETHGPQILQKAEELGADHPAVQGMMSPVEDIRRLATRSVWDLVGAGRSTVQKAKTDDVVEARVKEEQLRQGAAGIQQGGPRVPQTPKSPFWEQFDEELHDRGWDGERPQYGRGE
jgi:hypothetical protein